MKRLLLMVAVGMLAGCAMSPEKIEPAYVSPATYKGWDCGQLEAERLRVADALHAAAQRQRTARDHDTVGVLLVCVPVGSLGGNNRSQEIARLKGEWFALHFNAEALGCDLPDLGDPMEKRWGPRWNHP